MEFLQPEDWGEALEARAAHPGALPLWGGTDVMVDLNFGRERPEAILDLTRVRELAEWEERDGALRVGAGVSYTRAIDELGERAAGPGRRVAHRRLAADPQPRHDRRQPRLLLPRRRRAAAAVRVRRRDRAGQHPRHAPRPDRRVHHRPQAQRARARRADRRLPRRARERPAAVLQGRHAQRDGDRRLLVRARAAPGRAHASAPASARPARPRSWPPRPRRSPAGMLDWDGGAAPARRRTSPASASWSRGRGEPDRRRPRQRRLPPPRARRARAPLARLGLERAMRLTCTINGEAREVDGLWEGESLLHVLRERLGLPGAKNACEQGECGSCSVYLDGELVCSCLVLAGQAEGREIVTVEGLAPEGELSKVQEAFLAAGAVQCGFCTPGLIVATDDLLRRNPDAGPTRRSARRWPATCAAARATRRSSTRSGRRRDDAAGDRGLRDRHRRRRPHRARATGTSSSATASSTRSAPARRRRPTSEEVRIDGRGLLATPGLVNCHHHLYQWATRGLAQDNTLFEWLQELYPVWAHVDAAIEQAAARAGLVALARSGCTTASDHHYLFPRDAGDLLEVEIEAAREVGLRFHPCRGSMDLGRSQRRAAARRGRRGPRRDPRRLRRRDRPLPRHLARRDGADRARAVLAVLRHPGADARVGRARPLARRAAAHAHGRDRGRGALLPRAVRLPPGRVPGAARLARRRRLARPLRAPERVRGAPLRRDRDGRRALPELQRAARRGHRARPGARRPRRAGRARRRRRRLQRGRRARRRAAPGAAAARGWPAARARSTVREALELGTIHGARCLGREAEIGSLEPGKLADIALWRLDGVDHAGIEDPVAALVLGPRPLVDTLLVGGRVVVSGGELRTFDEGVAARDLLAQSRRLASRAGVAA